MRKIIISLISVTLVLFWGLGSLSANFSSDINLAFCFILTYGVIEFLNYKGFLKDKLSKGLLLTPALLYLALVFYAQGLNGIHLHPILWLTAFSIFVIFTKRGFMKSIASVLILCVYSFVLYPQTKFNHQNDKPPVVFNSELENLMVNRALNTFDVLWSEIAHDSCDFILIETWNEKCLPCLKSIGQLQDTLNQNQLINHVLLYQQMGRKNLSVEEVKVYKKIKNKNSIVIDVNNELLEGLHLESFPYFILYDKSGKYISHRRGYDTSAKSDIIEWYSSFTFN